jgi:hypothetical protein
VRPVAAAAKVRENECDIWMTFCEPSEITSVGNFLIGPFASAMLPDVMQNRKPMRSGGFANRIEQRIISSPAREQLNADCSALDATLDLRECVIGVIRIHCHIPLDARIFRELRHRIISD